MSDRTDLVWTPPAEGSQRQPHFQGSRHPVLLLLAAISAGILVDRTLDPGLVFFASGLLGGLAGWGMTLAWGALRLASGLLLIAWLSLGGCWHQLWWNGYPETEIGLRALEVGAPAVLQLRVIGEPRRMALAEPTPFDARPPEPRTLVPCRVEAVRSGSDWEVASGNLDLYVRADWREVNSGDRLQVVGELAAVASARNPGEFDFEQHFRGQRKLAVMFADEPAAISIISRNRNGWQQLRATWRAGLDNVIWQLVPVEYAGLASGVLLGNRQQIASEQRDRFMLSSTVHVISISGLHVGILAGLLFGVMRLGFVQRTACLWGVMGLVCWYAWLVEFSPPVTRAAVLICLYCGSRLTGRGGFSLNLLAVAGLVVLAMNPTDLFNVGAQLSFLAVAGMIGAEAYRRPSPAPLEQLIRGSRAWPVRGLISAGEKVGDAFRVSAVIWLLAAPIVAARFQLVSPIGLLINPLILLPMAAAMYCGVTVLLVGWWLPLAGNWAGWACGGCLAGMLWLVDWSLVVPGGYFWTTPPPAWSLLVFYLGAGLLFLKPRRVYPLRWLLIAYLVWWAVGWTLPQLLERTRRSQGTDCCEFTFVDVGHGLSTVVRLPDGRCLLYDAGSFGSSAFGLRSVASVLWSEGIEHLDAVVLSHADLDHYNALPELSQRFSIGVVYVSRQMLTQRTAALEALRSVLKARGIPLLAMEAGDVLESSEDLEIACLGPPACGTGGSDNSDSIVLAVSFRGKRALLTGDLEGPGLEQLLRGERFSCDLLVAPHHGSAGSRPEIMTGWAQPKLVVISCSERRLDRQSLRQYSATGARVLATGEVGAVGVKIGPAGIESSTWRGSRLEQWTRH